MADKDLFEDEEPKKPLRHDVLIIDDDPNIREILKTFCENLGVFKSIIVASDGSDASKKLTNQMFTLILMDINMPKKTGLHLVNEFDNVNLNAIEDVVIVTGEMDKKKLSHIMDAGVKYFLIKPFDEPTFQDRALKVLKRKRVEKKKKVASKKLF